MSSLASTNRYVRIVYFCCASDPQEHHVHMVSWICFLIKNDLKFVWSQFVCCGFSEHTKNMSESFLKRFCASDRPMAYHSSGFGTYSVFLISNKDLVQTVYLFWFWSRGCARSNNFLCFWSRTPAFEWLQRCCSWANKIHVQMVSKMRLCFRSQGNSVFKLDQLPVCASDQTKNVQMVSETFCVTNR